MIVFLKITTFFNFILLTFYFKDFFILTPFLIYFFFLWTFFLKNNFFSVRINPTSSDVLKNSKFLKKVHYVFFLNWVFINFLFFCLFIFTIKTDFNLFWFNHFKINNFYLNIICLVFAVSLFLIFIIKKLKNSNVNYNIDYFFSITNLTLFVPLIFLSNTMYTFLFTLELTSLTILYKFSVSRNWFNNENKTTFSRLLPKAYMNMIFFQYWANFFSSMLIMFSLFNLIFFFGSSEWLFLDMINMNNFNNYYFSKNIFFIYIWLSFFIGMFLKIGFTPIHLFKIEVYKGIPFISIFFYTTWYFLSFFLYFIIIVFYHLNSIKIYFSFIIFVFLIVGLLYSVILLFDVNLIKSFFAYSTVVNVLNFIIVLYLLLN